MDSLNLDTKGFVRVLVIALLVLVAVAFGGGYWLRSCQAPLPSPVEAAVATRQQARRDDAQQRQRADLALAYDSGRAYEITRQLDSLTHHAETILPGAPVRLPAHPPRE